MEVRTLTASFIEQVGVFRDVLKREAIEIHSVIEDLAVVRYSRIQVNSFRVTHTTPKVFFSKN